MLHQTQTIFWNVFESENVLYNLEDQYYKIVFPVEFLFILSRLIDAIQSLFKPVISQNFDV